MRGLSTTLHCTKNLEEACARTVELSRERVSRCVAWDGIRPKLDTQPPSGPPEYSLLRVHAFRRPPCVSLFVRARSSYSAVSRG